MSTFDLLLFLPPLSSQFAQALFGTHFALRDECPASTTCIDGCAKRTVYTMIIWVVSQRLIESSAALLRKQMELSFHPRNPFSHPILGDCALRQSTT